ncbi:MAG: aldo/keto reductase [Asticcacaulis sp.]
MPNASIAGSPVNPLGLGAMNLCHAYGVAPTYEDGIRLLQRALDLGVNHIDTAALYGFGKSETMVGEALKGRRQSAFLASKCGMTGVNGKRVIDGRPETLKATIDEALTRLQTDYVDLYYLHRLDPNVPIEESVGAMADMVSAGKVRALGLSEVSADTLKRAHAVHPIAALQTEYSLWSRNAEIAVLEATQAIGAAFVAFSPVGRGFLAGGVTDLNFAERDIRIPMPRFQSPNFEKNLELYRALKNLADLSGVTPAQLSLRWVLAQAAHIHVIPGTRSVPHLEENAATPEIDAAVLEAAGRLINQQTVSGPRYPADVQKDIDTEEFT